MYCGRHRDRGEQLADRAEQLACMVAELLDVSGAGLVGACQHPGLELPGPQTAVAGDHIGGDRLYREVEVLARRGAMRPEGYVGLLGLAERLDDTCRVAQDGAELGRGAVIKVGYGHDVLSRADDEGPEIHRAHDMAHHEGRGLVNDAPWQGTPACEEVTSEASDHVHARQDV
jgi:hypothetical protein